MAELTKEQERAELHRAIWAIADDLRGAVDGWDFKSYVLGAMFYRYISENFAVGLDSLTDGLVDINESDNTCTVDYDKYLYNAKNAAPAEEPKR